MYYQLRRGSTQKQSPTRISFNRYSKIWNLIFATFMKTINFAISFPVVILLFLVIPITLVFKWMVSMAHRIACLGGNLRYISIYNSGVTSVTFRSLAIYTISIPFNFKTTSNVILKTISMKCKF